MWLLESGEPAGVDALMRVCREELAGLETAEPGKVRLLLPGYRNSKRRRLAGVRSPLGENVERAGHLQIVEFSAASLLSWLEEQGSDAEARDRAVEGW